MESSKKMPSGEPEGTATETVLEEDRRPDVQAHYNSTTLKLITAGRVTGLPHIAMMRFVFVDGAYFVFAGSRKSDWFLNALSSGSAKVRLDDYVQAVACEEFLDVSMLRRLYTKKYGARVVRDWYSSPEAASLRLTPTSPAVARGAIRGEGQVKTDFRSWKARGVDYFASVADAFDSASEEYDFTIRGNFINVWTREKSIKEVLKLTRPDDVLLEIGCGTGTEAIRISKRVRSVVATDISPKMIAILQRKIETRKLDGKVRALEMRATDIARIKDQLPNGTTRLAYSFNGALNCDPEIEKFPGELWKVMEPGGFFVCSVRNKFCFEESLLQLIMLRLDDLTPRKKEPTMVSVGGMDIPAYYYYPGEFADFFRPHFEVRKIIALPAIVPPPYLNDYYVKFRSRLWLIEKADAALAGVFPFNRFGDQALFVFQRRESPGA